MCQRETKTVKQCFLSSPTSGSYSLFPPACFLALKKSILCLVSVYLGCCNLFLLPFPLAKSINFICTCKLCQCWQTEVKNNNKNIPKCTKQFAFQLKSLCIKKGQVFLRPFKAFKSSSALCLHGLIDVFFFQLQNGSGFHWLFQLPSLARIFFLIVCCL